MVRKFPEFSRFSLIFFKKVPFSRFSLSCTNPALRQPGLLFPISSLSLLLTILVRRSVESTLGCFQRQFSREANFTLMTRHDHNCCFLPDTPGLQLVVRKPVFRV